MSRLACLFALFVLLAPTPSAQAQELTPKKDLAERLREFESWIILEEEDVPEPAFLRLDLGFLAFIENRSRIRADRNNRVGTRLDDLEGSQGLDTAGVGAYGEFSLGGKIRGAADMLWYDRGGQNEQQSEEVVFDGVTMAQPGDFLRTRFEFLSLAGFVEWNAVYGKTYRIGLQGGLRYFRFDIEVTAARSRLQPPVRQQSLTAEILSPFFGGLIELTPFPVLSVFTSVQFIIWSWEQVKLRSTRFLNFRMGLTINPIPGVFGLTVEYRFLVVQAENSGSSRGDRRVEGALTSNGVGISVALHF